MIATAQQYGVATDPMNLDVHWHPDLAAATTALGFRRMVRPAAHLVIRDIGPARNVDGTEVDTFTAHADQALGLDA